jgi:hypothetical protein
MSVLSRRGNRFTRSWTKELVLLKIREWKEIMGQPPTGADWNPSRCRFFAMGNQARADRWWKSLEEYERGDYPSYTTVQDLFDGRWSHAVEEAGFVPLPPGRPSREMRQQWIGASDADSANQAGLEFQWEAVQEALRHPENRIELRNALLDLASIAATYAQELTGEE